MRCQTRHVSPAGCFVCGGRRAGVVVRSSAEVPAVPARSGANRSGVAPEQGAAARQGVARGAGSRHGGGGVDTGFARCRGWMQTQSGPVGLRSMARSGGARHASIWNQPRVVGGSWREGRRRAMSRGGSGAGCDNIDGEARRFAPRSAPSLRRDGPARATVRTGFRCRLAAVWGRIGPILPGIA